MRRAAERFQVSHTAAARWAGRYRQLGVAGMNDHSSSPHHQPARTPAGIEAEEWAYQRPYTSDAERQAAFTDWIDWYNYHRPHTGITGQTPASRVTNLSEQHT